MRKIILITISLLSFLLTSINAQENDPILQKLLDASGEDMYLKDFKYNLKAKSETSFSVVLSKNKYYGIYTYQEYKNQITYTVTNNNNESIDIGNSLNKSRISKLIFKSPKSAVFHFSVKNNSDKKSTSYLLLTQLNKNKENNEEFVSFEGKEVKREQIKDNKTDSEELFFTVEEMPTFKGKNSNEFKTYLQENLEYPQEALDKKIEGRVFVQFVVDKNGYIKDAKVMRGVHPSIDQEALRLIYSSPKWEPGKQRNKPVSVSFTFPILFRLP